MPTSLLQRRPDSGLGNIRASASAPSRNIDWLLLLAQGALSLCGLATVYSATWTKVANPFQFLQRQEIFLVLAVIVMVVVMAVDYDYWRERAFGLYIATVVLLVAVWFLGPLTSARGLRLSIDLGPINVQPAEFAKVTVLLALGAYLADDRHDGMREGIAYAKFVGGLILIGIPTSLVIIQPDLGSASVIVAMAMGVLLVAGARFKHIAMITVLSVCTVAAAVLARFVKTYQITRLTVFVNDAVCKTDPDACRQFKSSLNAVATGGLFGKGWLKGPITNSRTGGIAVQWADLPFSAIGEQFGLMGGAVIIALYAVVLFRIWRIGHMSRDTLGTYICAGAFTMILWQVFQNIGMTIGIMPLTGLPLPLISYGGSGLLAMFGLLGLVQNVYMRRYR